MRRSVHGFIAGVVVASLLLAAALVVQVKVGGTQTASASGGSIVHRVQHHFSLAPGESRTFTLPVNDTLVHVDVITPSNNHGTQTPSELMYAVINYETSSDQFTWIGTNSDGSQAGGNSTGSNTPSPTRIAAICGGSCPVWIAALDVQDASAGTLVFTQNQNTSSITGDYVLTFWWF